ncbi:PP2C family protein-serine/threonine phosphatase [Occallatibacter riparius]|uniref:Serine/threonine-protein phosphatase n=1 Tax=Occallatibacter riparius TaxID=1002689 RepID=A0A9J7BM21_9BACT|nr:PP2C family protein-serine/threonine phosphatase [Occallatibacter riparius]UWZ82253.1 serine/threonine-protein phosphatase [Occallatibacter riparius]
MGTIRRVLLPCLFLLVSALPSAQTPEPLQIILGQAAVPLYGPWKFTVGDSPVDPKTGNPLWAEPAFDDSQWETVDLKPKAGSFDPMAGLSGYVPGWTAKGHKGYWGYAWYRIRVQVNAHPGERLALSGPEGVDDVYQVFANGTLLGSFGSFPGGGRDPIVYNAQPRIFALPAANDADAGTRVLAFRVWMMPVTLREDPDAGGMHSPPLLGDYNAVGARYQLAWLELVRSYGSLPILAALYLLLAVMASSLVLFDPRDVTYRWLAAVFLVMAMADAEQCLTSWTQLVSGTLGLVAHHVIFDPLILGGWAIVWWTWFRLRQPAWMPRAIAALTLLYALSEALGRDLFFTAIPASVGGAFHSATVYIRLLFLMLLVFLAVRGIQQQKSDGWLALPALLLVGIARFQLELAILHVRTHWFPFGMQVSLGMIAHLLLIAVIFILLIRRVLLSVRRQRQLALDVKQAQEVQQVILPEHRIVLHGFEIESEYRPALEVGGDFFQIIPHASDDSLLIVAGDVAGKGLKAGMLVALLVGAIRSTAELDPEPAAILAALNRRLLGRGDARATCLALRIRRDGAVVLANAGHLPPYLNGVPVEIEGSLPLGLVENLESSMLKFQLSPSDRLLLVSDGVPEATDLQGKLFGFDRVLELVRTQPTAEKIADAAQTFGQEDDISVISVTRVTVAERTEQPTLAGIHTEQ